MLETIALDNFRDESSSNRGRLLQSVTESLNSHLGWSTRVVDHTFCLHSPAVGSVLLQMVAEGYTDETKLGLVGSIPAWSNKIELIFNLIKGSVIMEISPALSSS